MKAWLQTHFWLTILVSVVIGIGCGFLLARHLGIFLGAGVAAGVSTAIIARVRKHRQEEASVVDLRDAEDAGVSEAILTEQERREIADERTQEVLQQDPPKNIWDDADKMPPP